MKRNKLHIILVRSLTASVLADIRSTPHVLDKGRVELAYKETKERLDVLSQELAAMTGGINLNSPKQTAEFLYDVLKFKEPKERTEAGARKTDKATIAALECKSERQRRFVELYHEFNRLNETFNRYLAAFKLVCDKFNGELSVSFRQCSTATHRLSGSSVKIEYEDQTYNVQPQNIQRELKPLFTAPDGWLVGEADGAQLEFRGAAQLGDDPVAFQDIRDKVDVHTNTANAFVAAKDPSFVKLSAKEARQQAKPQTFKPLTYSGLAA